MKNNDKNSFYIVLGLFIVAAIARIVFDTNEYILHIIATINIVSLWYVVYLILAESDELLKSILNTNNIIGKNIKVKKRTLFKKNIKFTSVAILVLGLIYIIFFANNIANDIVGLLALFFSIEMDYLCQSIARYFDYKK